MYAPPERLSRGQLAGQFYVPKAPDGLDFYIRDDFDRDVLDPAWTLDNGASFSATPIDPVDSGFVAGDVRISYNAYRKSWCLLQSPEGSFHQLHRALPGPIPDNLFVMARIRTVLAPGGQGSADLGNVGLVIGQTAGGIVDPNNRVQVYCPRAGPIWNVQADALVGGVSTVGGPKTSGFLNQQGWLWQVLAIHKRGTNYHVWLATQGGHWTYLLIDVTTPSRNTGLPFAPAGTVDRVGLIWQSKNSPGPTVVGIDFFWAFETDDLPF